MKKTGIDKVCPVCARVFYVQRCRISIAKTCSKKCTASPRPDLIPWNKGKKGLQAAWNKGLPSKYKGIQRSEEVRLKISQVKKSKHLHHSPETLHKMSVNRRGKMTGEENHTWRGGRSRKSRIGYYSIEYVTWRTKVLERDDYTCQSCGIRGGKLQVDHELPSAFYPELRLDLLNGRVLCHSCHRATVTWGYMKCIGHYFNRTGIHVDLDLYVNN